ncbi:MAG: hypothetical protein WC044_14520 [Crocinitomicaceae bacterium]
MAKQEAEEKKSQTGINLNDIYILMDNNKKYRVDDISIQPNTDDVLSYHLRIGIIELHGTSAFSEELSVFLNHFSKQNF